MSLLLSCCQHFSTWSNLVLAPFYKYGALVTNPDWWIRDIFVIRWRFIKKQLYGGGYLMYFWWKNFLYKLRYQQTHTSIYFFAVVTLIWIQSFISIYSSNFAMVLFVFSIQSLLATTIRIRFRNSRICLAISSNGIKIKVTFRLFNFIHTWT